MTAQILERVMGWNCLFGKEVCLHYFEEKKRKRFNLGHVCFCYDQNINARLRVLKFSNFIIYTFRKYIILDLREGKGLLGLTTQAAHMNSPVSFTKLFQSLMKVIPLPGFTVSLALTDKKQRYLTCVLS